ncbi:MAG TPA: D-alanyl-D-alanine carboxypeptidase/D-alanyl-D-alanine-endopeptidase [Candidatus Bacteroides intestinavium]|uniref:D-alanyl-D-alanine carboxypeptidase/D-alanyl-D-alanine-endopeptidase n=1 Tax=Candidatus Bacteroides intestinavium TaxID=2838469 RepID=A0A9D2HTZ0_9BACE|nr:D-alanyl-D-alanine carboxypeptidase/D-alanyl-D-alanine-endopeptidase [Candidatus Bacteroides intestinavium]
MKKAILSLLLAACTLTLAAQEAAADSLHTDTLTLAQRLDSLVAKNMPQGSNVGIAIYDLTAGRPVYDYQADRLSRPASTMKLLTAIAALSHPDARDPFRTEVWYQGTVQADTLRGDLYVVGGFDPEFDDEALDSLVEAVARLPFSAIKGKVYGDVSMKDSLHWGSGWLWDDNPSAFQPYLSPLMLEKGVVTVTARPAERGMPALLKCTPASTYYHLVNRTESRTPRAGGFRLTRDWMHNSNTLVATGNVGGRTARVINIYSSQDFFMHTFVERLQDRGMVADPLYGFREFHPDSLSVRVAVHETSMQAVLDQCLKESDNLNAEALLYRLGKQTTGRRYITADDGLDAVARLIEQLGLNPDDYNLADGCGLSHYDYVTPELLVALLRYAYSRTNVFQSLYKALPVSGIDGTLEHRMGYRTPGFRRVHAKTGTYTGVSCLAGYLQAKNGHWVAFAIMNQNTLSGRKARKFQDTLCTEVITGLR